MPGLPKYLGVLARTIVALIPLSGFANAASSDMPQFRDVAALRVEVISRLKADSRVKQAIPNPADPARLDVTRVGSTGKDIHLQVDVTNLLGRIRDLPAGEAETEIERFLTTLVLSDSESGFQADLLIANIRQREHLDAFKGDGTEPDKGPAFETLAGDVVILYQIDNEDSLASVRLDDVGDRSLAQLRQLALENINKQITKVKQERILDGISIFTVEGDEAISPALLLTEKFWATLGPQFPNGVFIAIPKRDAIVVVDKRLPNAVQFARSFIDKVFKTEPDLLSEYIFERRDGKLQVVAEQ
ncbi:hypothetical protein [Mesorhizobium sp. M0091]|uniref:hypothetical protein n=1 Tax=Mesorhizobium sp. M0091 TaxID=2956875 RepID=UPI0033359FE6